MTAEDKRVLIQSFTQLINDNLIIDYTISGTMKEINVTGPDDKEFKFEAGERTIDIRVVYS